MKKLCQGNTRKRTILFCILAIVILVGVIVAVYLAVKHSKKDEKDKKPVSDSYLDPKVEVFEHAAVSADSSICSVIGKDLLQKGGNAADAMVGALFCAGVVNVHSTGIGGGGFSVVYDPKTKKSYALDHRETAPGKASRDMYLKEGASSLTGGLAIAVPGEVKGLYELWKQFGKLKWADLVEPSRKLAADGFPLTQPVHEAAKVSLKKIEADPGLSALFLRNGEVLKVGETLKSPQLGKTFEIIRDNPHDFYNGSLAKRIVKDIQDAKGIVTLKDLQDYKVRTREVLKMTVNGDQTLHIMGPPSGGVVVAMILNIVQGFGFTKDDVSTMKKKTAAVHKVVEAFKFSYAHRALLGDPNFLNKTEIKKIVDKMLDRSFADNIRMNKIWANQTHSNTSYYGGYYGKDDHGTTHVSVLDKDGMAVSSTTSINYYFGNGQRSLDTGIVYNNEMDDFSTPGKSNAYGYPPTPANFIAPGKTALSSMSPVIITDKNDKAVFVVGAAGGSKIITAVAQTIINKLFFGMDLGHAVVDERYHHQLLPNVIHYESKWPLPVELREGLMKLGHKLKGSRAKSVVQGIYKNGTHVIGKTDPRKISSSAGY